MHDWYPSYPKAEEIGEAKAIISARKVALMQNTVTKALEIYFLRIDSLLVSETEASCLESKDKNYLKYSYISHELSDYSIAFRA